MDDRAFVYAEWTCPLRNPAAAAAAAQHTPTPPPPTADPHRRKKKSLDSDFICNGKKKKKSKKKLTTLLTWMFLFGSQSTARPSVDQSPAGQRPSTWFAWKNNGAGRQKLFHLIFHLVCGNCPLRSSLQWNNLLLANCICRRIVLPLCGCTATA